MDQATITAIFTAAAGATSWKRTNLGLRATVDHGGYTWTVQAPQDSGPAYIAGSSGYGGSTSEYIEASWAQTIPIVDAAMAATRLH
ncbi:hypothetical protein ACFVH9_08385 [Streptomyces hirsutus]|uniref:hypothetical protein n=1 Tax=Streptomyces hirsutus TaxID=35620 RepID=UPI00362AFEEB